ncbi:hypothetical protein TNIN_352051 [Trichonephila inaurata madagascariensis]|uniref:Uncharacterized protein n=1 Tax=Trichonephila inaurata madagascariensis TaxID=2747483 RepID=A0A8X7C6M9_9ARAC|nr:hypothetical protein TNIN_352051 [Trichonephila inaurata madagascariensis]
MVMICLVLLVVIIQTVSTGYINSTKPSKDSGTIDKNSTVVSTTVYHNVTNKSAISYRKDEVVCNEIPFQSSITMFISIPDENLSATWNFVFGGKVGNPNGDKFRVIMRSLNSQEMRKFEFQLLILDESGNPMPPLSNGTCEDIQRMDFDHYLFNEQKTYQTYSTDDPFTFGIICIKFL